jgi:hypothetical protein
MCRSLMSLIAFLKAVGIMFCRLFSEPREGPL